MYNEIFNENAISFKPMKDCVYKIFINKKNLEY